MKSLPKQSILGKLVSNDNPQMPGPATAGNGAKATQPPHNPQPPAYLPSNPKPVKVFGK